MGLSRDTAVVIDDEGGDWQEKARQGLVQWLEFWGLLDQDHAAENRIFRAMQRVERQPEPDSLTYRQRVLMALERYYLLHHSRRKFQDDFKAFREFFYPNAEKLEETHCLFWCAFIAGYFGINGHIIILQYEEVVSALDRAARVIEAYPEMDIDLPDVRVFAMSAALYRFPVKPTEQTADV